MPKKKPASPFTLEVISSTARARNMLVADIRELAPRQLVERICADARERLVGVENCIRDYDQDNSPLRRDEARRRANEIYEITTRLTQAHLVLMEAIEKPA